MFEFWFHGLSDDVGNYTFTGTTVDFLEVCCQITQYYDAKVAGEFIAALLENKKDELQFLRIVDWNFEYAWEVPDPDSNRPENEGWNLPPIEKKIIIKKLR